MTAWFSSSVLFRRLVGPVIGLLLVAVLANVTVAAWLAAQRTTAAAAAIEQQVTGALAASRVPLAPPILTALHQLTSCHFVIADPAAPNGIFSTATATDWPTTNWQAVLAGTAQPPDSVQLASGDYRVSLFRSQSVRPQQAVLLIPLPAVTRVTLEAVAPMLVVAGIMLAILIPLGLSVTGRLTRRIIAIQGLVGRIAAGAFGSQLTPGPPAAGNSDEIDRLGQGVNQMSSTLASLRDSLVAGERQRLLGQLAAGFAHELRNAITGSRLAIDLHRRRCPLSSANATCCDNSLAVAIRQLDILEAEVRGLLTLGRPDVQPPVTQFDLAELLHDVHDLTVPRLEHTGVDLFRDCPPLLLSARREPLRAAVVNLLLNAIDAAGPGGRVRLTATVRDGCCVIAVEDNGPGLPPALANSMSEPFVTGKKDGVGLGLAVARVVAEERGGGLNWSQHDGLTRFELSLPLDNPDPLLQPHGRPS